MSDNDEEHNEADPDANTIPKEAGWIGVWINKLGVVFAIGFLVSMSVLIYDNVSMWCGVCFWWLVCDGQKQTYSRGSNL